MDKTRQFALQCLYKIEKEKSFTNIVLDECIKRNKEKLTKKDIGFLSQIVYGTVTWKLTIDEIIKKYSKIKIKKISLWILNILRMGIYQIVFLDKVPKSAAVNESVNLAKRYGNTGSKNFVNAILRKVSKEDYQKLFEIKDPLQKIVKTTSTPEWLVKKLLEQYSINQVEYITNSWNEIPNISIRTNSLKINQNELQEKLEKENIKVKKADIDPFFIVEDLKQIEKQTLFKKGFFTVQDVSAGMCSLVLAPEPGQKVLDACAAPGGKTTHLAELMKNQGELLAWDLYEHRLELVKKNVKRLGISIIKTEARQAQIEDKEYIGYFDKILLDVPCLGLGVIKRKPDIKWQRKLEDIEKIQKIQFDILNTCSKYLKSGGELVYSTCSILKEENQDVIEMFLDKNKNFEIITKTNLIDDNIKEKYLASQKYWSILPENDKDGFFIAKLSKKM